MVKITINGKEYEAKEGVKIINFCREQGIELPTLCHIKDYSDIGSCRLCMVEIEGYEKLFAACRTKVEDGMVITTESQAYKIPEGNAPADPVKSYRGLHELHAEWSMYTSGALQ